MSPPVVEMVAGTVTLGGRPVLRDVSVRVESGETVAILGANGSGKSTLVRTALGLVPLSGGETRLYGVPVTRFKDWKRVGYVPQRLGAGSGVPATVREVVAAGRLARRWLAWPATAADRRAVDAALATVGLSDRARDPVATLSGGQQQRTLIARALAGEPDLLVMDEPTAGVDTDSQRRLADALATFSANGGTVLLVAHELGPLEPLVRRAVVMHAGRVAHDGACPRPTGEHALPGHEHVHPHAPPAPGEETMWSAS